MIHSNSKTEEGEIENNIDAMSSAQERVIREPSSASMIEKAEAGNLLIDNMQRPASGGYLS